MEGKDIREEKYRKFSEHMKCITHYMKDGIHHPGIDQKQKRAVLKATSSNQYKVDGKYITNKYVCTSLLTM